MKSQERMAFTGEVGVVDLWKSFGKRTILAGARLSVRAGESLAIMGQRTAPASRPFSISSRESTFRIRGASSTDPTAATSRSRLCPHGSGPGFAGVTSVSSSKGTCFSPT